MKKDNKNNQLPLSDLPQYTPPESVWKHIAETLEEADAKDISASGSSAFPKYTPPADIWNSIESSLDLQNQFSELPVHTPPDFIWKNIDKTLSGDKQTGFTPLLKWAAAILLLAGIAIVINLFESPSPELEYHVEWEQDEGSMDIAPGISGFELIAKLCARSREICDTPEFSRLEIDLSELEKARELVKSQMNPYGDNDDLERMLMRIEMEHAEIMKQMASTLL